MNSMAATWVKIHVLGSMKGVGCRGGLGEGVVEMVLCLRTKWEV